MRVLLIEDEDHIREIAQLSLESVAGWETRQASGGHEGLALAASEHPDAILLDVMMPDLDGPGTLARLRADPATADIPVVFLTAKTRTSERQELQELGAAGVIKKPFDPMSLAAQVAEILGWTL
ncbi:MAG TPA: response regulator [Ornithinimicrobium sp.]|uniref:response regulator n=1 Tax=Ornithinimicrobium sp. TaxID=1977084 RepID=UPI002B471C63|nr:response regulator [Ornithinimicrobium sp.]HKJ11376.1 response regulator [Ornithinimicrobium sp.]